jgi:PAS domain-containing protein
MRSQSFRPTEPLPLHHSWPLAESERRFELGYVLDRSEPGWARSVLSSVDRRELARCGIGLWECDLTDNALSWSAEVYDIFGFPRDAYVSRDETVRLYCEDSRAAMERLRAYAIKHQRGFTLDAQIRPVLGRPRWMRLTAAPVCEGDRVVRLHGLKQII